MESRDKHEKKKKKKNQSPPLSLAPATDAASPTKTDAATATTTTTTTTSTTLTSSSSAASRGGGGGGSSKRRRPNNTNNNNSNHLYAGQLRQLRPYDESITPNDDCDDDYTIDTIDRPGAHRIGGDGDGGGDGATSTSGTITTFSSNQNRDDTTRTRTTSTARTGINVVGNNSSTIINSNSNNGDDTTTIQTAQEHLVTAYLVEENENDNNDNDEENQNNTTTTTTTRTTGGPSWRWIIFGFGIGLIILAIVLIVVLLGNNTNGDNNNNNNNNTDPPSAPTMTTTTPSSPPASAGPSAATPSPTARDPTPSPTAGPIEWQSSQVILASSASNTDPTFGRSLSLSSSGQVLAIGGSGQVHAFFDPDGDGLYDTENQPRDEAHYILPPDVVDRSPSFGNTIDLSNDGLTIAVGEPDNNQVHVLRFNGVRWSPEGNSPINPEMLSSSGGNAGIVIALARERSNIVAIGNGANQVQVFIRIGNEWTPRGDVITGTQIGGPNSIGISDSGTILAIGDPDADPGFREGIIRMYSWNSNFLRWDTLGNDIVGLFGDSRFGESISLSGNGLVVAGIHPNTGRVRVFEWISEEENVDDGGQWIQRGPNLSIVPESLGQPGRLVKLNVDGTILMISTPSTITPSNSGTVDIFHYYQREQQWIRRGENSIEGDPNDNGLFYFGSAITMSSDGTILATSRTNGNHFSSRKKMRKEKKKKQRRRRRLRRRLLIRRKTTTMTKRTELYHHRQQQQENNDDNENDKDEDDTSTNFSTYNDDDDDDDEYEEHEQRQEQRKLQLEIFFGGIVSIYQAIPITN